MNNNITIFENNQFGKIRTVGECFVAQDVAKALGYSDTFTMTRRLDEDEKDTQTLRTPGGEQSMIIINESGLYNAIIGSKLPNAKTFKKWVTSEVLPSIRKNGLYATPETAEQILNDPDFLIGILKGYKEEKEKRLQAEEQLQISAPKVAFANAVSQSDTSILIGQFAKILNQNGFDIGQNRLFAWMRKNKYLMDVGSNRNVPSQNAMDMKLFEIKETAIFHCDGHSTVSITSKLTGKGQLYFMDKFMKMRERGEI